MSTRLIFLLVAYCGRTARAAPLGFVGHYPAGVLIEMPYKKPRNGVLSFSQQLYNQMLNPLRVVIEPHRRTDVNSGIKRLRMIKDTLRVHNIWFRDTVMEVACGLHNFRVASPERAYLAHEREKMKSCLA